MWSFLSLRTHVYLLWPKGDLDNQFYQFSTTLHCALDFFSTSHASTYLDDVVLAKARLGVNDFSKNVFSVYPNPVKDVLNIQSKGSVTNVTVYNILEKVVLKENPGEISLTINRSSLTTGSYLVKATLGNTPKTVKIFKKDF